MKIIRKIFEVLSRYGWSATLVVLGAMALAFTWSSSDEMFSSIRLFDRIAFMVDQNYVERIDRGKLIRAGVDGMLDKLDRYTKFLEGGDYIKLQQTTDGKMEGIGIYMEYHHDTLTVVSVPEGTPGYKAGIKPGDRVIMIDSSRTAGLELNDVRMLMKGRIGTQVDLRIARPDDGTFTVKAVREEIDIQAIPYYDMVSADIGYVRLSRFSENCSKELGNAIRLLKKRGMKSLILDMRDNPGGLLAEAIEVAGLFLPSNSSIVETRGRDGLLVASFSAYGDPVFPDGELAVLIDSQTASAAEIVAGAIQDHDRGVIIGTSSYGKGLVQQVLSISDASALKITTSRYHLPSGRCLQKPDWTSFELLPEGDKYRDTDSLYFTMAGRPVFGGGGITPDIFIEDEPESDYIEALKKESAFFDFATSFIKRNEIDPDFNADDEIISEFRRFLREKNFKFEEEDRIALDQLRDIMKVADSETEAAMKLIDNKISSKEQWYFDSNYATIADNLDEAILMQKFGENMLYKLWIAGQPEIASAIEVLSNTQKYSSIFTQR